MTARARSFWTISGVGTVIIYRGRARTVGRRSNPACLYETSRTPQTGHITNMTEPCPRQPSVPGGPAERYVRIRSHFRIGPSTYRCVTRHIPRMSGARRLCEYATLCGRLVNGGTPTSNPAWVDLPGLRDSTAPQYHNQHHIAPPPRTTGAAAAPTRAAGRPAVQGREQPSAVQA